MVQISKPFSLNQNEIISILKGALIAAGGAGLTYLLNSVGHIDFGILNTVVAAVIGVLINIVRKYLTVNN